MYFKFLAVGQLFPKSEANEALLVVVTVCLLVVLDG